MAMKSLFLSALVLGVVIADANLPQYRATQFSLPWDAIVGKANSRGDVVYTQEFEGTRRTFVRRLDGDTTILPLLPGIAAAAGVAINDHGVVAVVGFLFGDASRVYTWSESTGYVQMPALSGPVDSNQGPTDITNNGVVSWSTSGFLSAGNARGLWNTNTNEITYFPDRAGGHTYLRDVSEGGYAVGTSSWFRFGAIYHSDGTGYQLRPSPSYASSFYIGENNIRVSNDGIAVTTAALQGSSSTQFASYIWDKFGNIIEERVNLGYGYSAISGDGLIAGSDFSQPGFLRPFLYEQSAVRTPLDGLVIERNFSGELLGEVRELYDNHAVLISQGGGGVGVPRSYVFLEPVPEPGTMLALGAGLAALLRRRRPIQTIVTRRSN